MRALQVNFTSLGICMCSTELLRWKNQKRSTRYPMTLQKRDSIVDIFPGANLGRGRIVERQINYNLKTLEK